MINAGRIFNLGENVLLLPAMVPNDSVNNTGLSGLVMVIVPLHNRCLL